VGGFDVVYQSLPQPKPSTLNILNLENVYVWYVLMMSYLGIGEFYRIDRTPNSMVDWHDQIGGSFATDTPCWDMFASSNCFWTSSTPSHPPIHDVPYSNGIKWPCVFPFIGKRLLSHVEDGLGLFEESRKDGSHPLLRADWKMKLSNFKVGYIYIYI
jgi:hypothetical protein